MTTDTGTQEFVIVHCSLKEFNDIFKKRKDAEIINYHDIMAKLENNDIYKNVPDRSVIEYYIVKKINHVLANSKVNTIYYFLENLELEIIQSVKRIVGYKENLEYTLMLIEDDDIDDIKNEFDTIQILKNDKA
jgi:flagellar biosynthesis chaperone FliJ